MSDECSKFFSKLTFDNPAMEGSLADWYFKNNRHTFGTENGSSVTDTLANIIYSSPLPVRLTNFKSWIASTEYRRQFFVNLASEIKKNIQLIVEIEYYIRGIPIAETKDHLCKLIEVCNVIAESTPLVYNSRSVIIEKVVSTRYYVKNTSSIIVFFDVLYSLAASEAVEVFAETNTGVLVHHFKTLVETCDKSGFLPNIGPYFDSSDRTGFVRPCDGSSMVVCNGGDLDSAVDAVIKGAWSCNGFLPYALKRILVQDSVWDEFVNKLSYKLQQFMWKFPNNYKPDSSTLQVIKNVNDIYNMTKVNGQKILKMNDFFYDLKNNDTFLKPLVLLDEEPYFWQNLNNDLPTPVVSLQAFRTSKEALLLLNKVPMNNLSVWCNNISICNEIAMKVDVTNVWINTFGLHNTCVNVIQGIYNKLYRLQWHNEKPKPLTTNVRSKHTNLDSEVALKKVTQVQTQWLTWSKEKKLATLLEVANYFEENYSKFKSIIGECKNIDVSEDNFKDGIKQLRQVVSTWTMNNDVHMKGNHMCVQFKKPLGTVYIDNKCKFEGYLAAIASATLFGNAVLCPTDDDYSIEICESFLKFNVPVVTTNHSVLERTFNLIPIVNDFNFASNAFTKSKFVWYSYGESFYDAKTLNVTN